MTGTVRVANRLADLLFVPPMDRWWRRRMCGRVACLLYHRVGEPGDDAFLTRGGSPVIRADQLARELRFLQGLGARFGTFADLRAGWFPGDDEVSVIVSFDDGFRSNYDTGLDVLESLGIHAVFFQVTGMIDANALLWEHALYWHTRDDESAHRFAEALRKMARGLSPPGASGREVVVHLREQAPGPEIERLLDEVQGTLGDEGQAEAARRAYPTAEAILRAHEGGHEIGSHGDRHYKRATIDDPTFETDLARSVGVLTDLLGRAPEAFSYPFNSYRTGDGAIVGRHFRQAATVDKRAIERGTDPLWIPRFTWPGHPRNALRHRRWLLTGTI